LHQSLGVEPELIAGRGGVFEVAVDGRTVFSKKEAGRFPEDGEVLDLIRSATSA